MLTRPYGWSLALGAGAAVLGALPLALHASGAGVEPARTGGFGEMTCQQCHWENTLNDPAGRIAVAGLPDAYTPGEQYLITVTLARPDLRRAGFQMAAREDGINMSAGSNAGTLRPTDELTTAVQAGAKGTTYIQHTEPGTTISSAGTARWTVEWTAPESAGVPVVFHVAANAANDDSSPLGDFIYTTTASSR
jgi:hypothetical protein